MIEILGQYLINIQANISRKKAQKPVAKNELSEDTKFDLYDYDILWSLIISPPEIGIPKKLKDLAVECLVKVIIWSPDLANTYIVKSGKGVFNNSPSVLMEMKVLKKLYCQV